MNWLKINGKEWKVHVTAISESFNILYSDQTGRTLAKGARMSLDPLGTFYGHKVTVSPMNGHLGEFDELFNFLSQPRYDGVLVEAVHGQNTIQYEAYVSSGERVVKHIDAKAGIVYYEAMDINIVPMEAQVTPL